MWGSCAVYKQHAFLQEQIDLAAAIATQSTVLINNMLLYQKVNEAQKRLRASFQASGTLLSSQSPDKVLEDIVEQARVAADATRVRVIIHSAAGQPRIIAGATTEKNQESLYPVRPDGMSWASDADGAARGHRRHTYAAGEIEPCPPERRDEGVLLRAAQPPGQRIRAMSFLL